MKEPDTFETATSLGHAIRAGSVTSLSLVDSCLSFIVERDQRLGAFREVFANNARNTARGLDSLTVAGGRLGPLHGVPIALKDMIEVAGTCSSNGMATRTAISSRDATVVERLRAGGMVILGKTHMVECAFGGWGTNMAMGTPNNPFDNTLHRAPGGSSSGSAVAVAGGMVPIALGSDTGGSVRIPASLCGLVGFKPTFGLIPTAGTFSLSSSLDTIGVLSRCVEDAALVFGVLTGTSVPPSNDSSLLPRFGIPSEAEMTGLDPDVAARLEEAFLLIEKAGGQLVPVSFESSFEDMVTNVDTIISAEAYASYRGFIEDISDTDVLRRLEAGRDITASAYIVARNAMMVSRRRAEAALRSIDAFLTPTTPVAAPLLTEIDQQSMELSRFTRAVNYLGLCAISLPAGITRKGLPVGLQIITPGGADHNLLRLAGWCETQLPQVNHGTGNRFSPNAMD